jgi:hypothetical protein
MKKVKNNNRKNNQNNRIKDMGGDLTLPKKIKRQKNLLSKAFSSFEDYDEADDLLVNS